MYHIAIITRLSVTARKLLKGTVCEGYPKAWSLKRNQTEVILGIKGH